MTRKLLIVFASGLVFAMILLSSAWVIGGQELKANIEKGDGWGITIDDDDKSGPTMTRTLELGDTKLMKIEVPVTLNYSRDAKSQMTVSGPEKLVNKLRWENGRLFMEGRSISFSRGLTVTITAPMMPDLDVRGASEVDLTDLDQPSLSIDAAGALELDGTGKVATLDIDAKGASDINLSDVEAKDAKVSIAGAGDVDISANGKVDAAISGAGNITLHRKPAELTSRTSGAGSIDHSY
jgi:hypothetical protein